MTRGRLAPPAASARAASSRRLPFALSARAIGLLAAGLVFTLPALVDRRALALMAAYDVVILALAWSDLRRLPRPGELTVTRQWRAPLTLGVPCPVEIVVESGAGRAATVRVADYVAPALRPELPVVELHAAANVPVSATYDTHPLERGDHQIGPAVLTWWSTWHLVERWADAALDQTVRVYPDLVEGRREALYLIRSRQIALEKRRARHAGTGREFESLRDYRDGDDRRDIYWPASARRAKLVTRVYQPERSQSVWVLVDAGRLLRARAGDRTMLDATAAAAVTLAQVALASGDKVGLLAYGRRLEARLAPARGAGQLRLLVEALATVSADTVESDHASAAAALLAVQSRRALVVWLTEIAETAGVPDVIAQALAMTSRHAVLFAVMRHPAMRDLAASVPGSAGAMYRIAAAQETLERRDVLLQRLRQRGALVVEMSPSDLAGGIVDRYLEARDRGII